MQMTKSTVDAIREIIKLGDRINVEEMASVSEIAEAAGGTLASVDPDDERCGNGKIRFPWPPKDHELFFKFINTLVEYRLNTEILINGIPAPDFLVVNISRQIGRQFNR